MYLVSKAAQMLPLDKGLYLGIHPSHSDQEIAVRGRKKKKHQYKYFKEKK